MWYNYTLLRATKIKNADNSTVEYGTGISSTALESCLTASTKAEYVHAYHPENSTPK